MNRYAICCIGHITLDKVITPRQTVFMPGGTAYYFSHAIARLCKNYLLITAIADSEMQTVQTLEDKGVAVKRLRSKHTVFFENRYGQNPDERSQRVLQQADTFSLEDVMDTDATIFHFGPLLANDIPCDVMVALAGKGMLSLDVQGLLRKVEDEKVVAIDWKAKENVLPHVHFLKANEQEMYMLTDTYDVEQGAKRLAGWGVKEVIITLGSKGSAIYHQNQLHHIKAFQPGRLIDATGCGDTYIAGYLFKRINKASIPEAAEFAAAMATLKLESMGPFTGSEQDVQAVICQG